MFKESNESYRNTDTNLIDNRHIANKEAEMNYSKATSDMGKISFKIEENNKNKKGKIKFNENKSLFCFSPDLAVKKNDILNSNNNSNYNDYTNYNIDNEKEFYGNNRNKNVNQQSHSFKGSEKDDKKPNNKINYCQSNASKIKDPQSVTFISKQLFRYVYLFIFFLWESRKLLIFFFF